MTGIITEATVLRFHALFKGNSDSYGRYYKENNRGETAKGAYCVDDTADHLRGGTGLGVVPIRGDGTVMFGAIDIDSHGDAPDIDLESLYNDIKKFDLPLIVCRSKSGGAHCYLFGAEPLKATNVRRALGKWSEMLGYHGAEIFPKQSKLELDSNGDRQLGSWLNLCFFDAENPDQLRYMYDGKKRTDINYFLDHAEVLRLTNAQLIQKEDPSKNGAPPCISKLEQIGVEGGHRNDAFYSVCVYLRKAYPKNWKSVAMDRNASMFNPPLKYDEAQKIIASVGRKKDYRYKCQQEPLKSNCNSVVCVEMAHGITKDERAILRTNPIPEFTNIRKHMTDPVIWQISVGNVDMRLSTKELRDPESVATKLMEHANIVVVPPKKENWLPMVDQWVKDAVIIEPPKEAKRGGQIMLALSKFVERCNPPSVNVPLTESRMDMLSGIPVLEIEKDHNDVEKPYVLFRGSDFIEYCKRSKTDFGNNGELWLLVRDVINVTSTKVRVSGKSNPIRVWKWKLNQSEYQELFDNSHDMLEVQKEMSGLIEAEY